MIDEDDESQSFNVRISAAMLVDELFQAFKEDALGPFAEALSIRLQVRCFPLLLFEIASS